jgi:hypothetical protein
VCCALHSTENANIITSEKIKFTTEDSRFITINQEREAFYSRKKYTKILLKELTKIKVEIN